MSLLYCIRLSFFHDLELFTCITLVYYFVIIGLLLFDETVGQLLLLVIRQLGQNFDSAQERDQLLPAVDCTLFNLVAKGVAVQRPQHAVGRGLDLRRARHVLHERQLTEALAFVLGP